MKQELIIEDDYRPAEDEPFMNERQLEYFRRKLLAWKSEILSDSRDAGPAAQAGQQDRQRAAPHR